MHTQSIQQPTTHYFCRIEARVSPVVSLGATAYGERRYVPIIGGAVSGPEFSGQVIAGGVDWQMLRSDGTLDIAAHYVIQSSDNALIEVRSTGYRHGPPDVMRRLAMGEAVAPGDYYFRTTITFQTGARQWSHLNSVIAIGMGARSSDAAIIDVHLVQ